MPLSTYTLDRMQEREERKRAERLPRLEQAERRLEVALFPDDQRRLRAQISATRRSMAQLFARRNAMEQATYEVREGQIARFNDFYRTDEEGDPWDVTYVPVSTLLENDRVIYLRIPHYLLFRRVQDAFVRPEDRIIPGRPNTISQFGIEGIPLDPECVSDALARELGLVTYPDKSTPEERWRLKHTPQFVEGLRTMLTQSKPITNNNTRVLILPDHRILYFSENVNAQDDPRRPPLKVSLFPDTYGFLRKTHHEAHLYAEERKKLEGIRTRLKEAINPRIAEWTRSTPQAEKDRIAAECLPVFEQFAGELNDCIDVYKRIAGDTLAGITDFTVERSDGERVVNPPAVRAMLVKVCNRLDRRLGQASRKDTWNTADRDDIEREIHRSETVFTTLRKKLKTATNQTATDCALPSRFYGLNGIRTAPFAVFAEKIGAIREREIAPAKEREDDAALIPALVKSYVVTKFQKVNRVFEQLKVKMLQMEHLGVADLQTCIEELEAVFTPIDIFPDIRVQEYVEPFENMCTALRTIKNGLAHYAAQKLTREERLDLFERFRKYLESFDIPAMVRELPVGPSPTPTAEVS